MMDYEMVEVGMKGEMNDRGHTHNHIPLLAPEAVACLLYHTPLTWLP